MNPLSICLLNFLLILTFWVKAQSVSGNVSDADTGEPVPFATVYFSGTMIGTTTDLDGNFSFRYSNKGNYTLVVSYVGYKDYLQEITETSSRELLRIALQPEVIQLADVYVQSDPKQWEENFPAFKRLFLGPTSNATRTDIENPKDIYLFYDDQENVLYAHAKEDVLIRNDALGYRIFYNMKEFEMDYRTREFRSFGIPRFAELQSESNRQTKRWSKARMEAYRGSFIHFLSAVKDDRIGEEEFIVRELFRIPNPQRLSESVIEEKIKYFRNKLGFQSGKKVVIQASTPETDSLSYWNKQKNMPALIDSLGAGLTRREDLMEGNTFSYVGALQIIYKGESEDPNYASTRLGGGIDRKQTSVVDVFEPFVFFPNNAYEVQKVFFQGYMGWSAKMAEMLPLEYRLPAEN